MDVLPCAEARWRDTSGENGAPAADGGEVGALIAGTAAAHPEELVQNVAEHFFRDRGLEAVALVRDRRPVGLLTRARLLLKLARGFGHDLYARRPVARIADPGPLVVGAAASAAAVVPAALARSPETVYDEVIVVDGRGEYLGLLPVRELVLQQSIALARSAAEHEAALERTRELEKLEHLRGQFLAHATHELRSPVNAIATLADILRRAGARGDLAGVNERLPLLVQCTAGLRATINNLLDLSRLEAGRMELNVSRFRAAELLEEVATTTRLLLASRPVQVRVEVPERIVLDSDQQKLRQVLVNLASNAAKFTEAGEISLSAERSAGGVRLAVRDTGCGISPGDVGRLFVPFGQLEEALVKVHEGTGLGLVIARSMATLLGGRIQVASAPGQGSTFTVHLPHAVEESAA